MDKEDILNSALEKLASGEPAESVLLALPEEYRNEFKPLLEMAESLYQVPKNTVPAPAMRRKYMLQPSARAWISWLGISRFAAASLSVMLIVSALGGTAYAAFRSLPGQSLFGLKKSLQSWQVSLASSPNAKAQLQLAIAQQRLQEAQTVLQDPSTNTQQKTAAVNELVASTNDTVTAVSAAAHADSQTNQNPPLLASLENITQQQKTLLTQATSNAGVAQVASSALAATQQNANQVQQIKQYLQIASSEQTLSQAVSNPNAVTISGFVTATSTRSVTVEKTNFTVNANTVITDSLGNPGNLSQLATSSKVTAVGTVDGKLIVAQEISIISPAVSPSVEGASTSTPASASSSPPSNASSTSSGISKTSGNAASGNSSTSSSSAAPTPTPNIATGSFIIENPNPENADSTGP